MSVFDDMAYDGGYRGEEAEQVARQLEEDERRKQEERDQAERDAAQEYDREHDHACCPPDDCCGGPCAAHPHWDLTT